MRAVLTCALLVSPLVAQEVRQAPAVDGEVMVVAFSGHTYGLMQRDLQFEHADDIRAHDPDLVVVAGDVVTGSASVNLGHEFWSAAVLDEQWAKYQLFRSRLATPVMFVAGNHDFYMGREATRADVMEVARRAGEASAYWSFDYGPFRLVLLTTMDLSGAPRRRFQLDAEQLSWLQALLAATAPERTVLLFMHHPLWDMSTAAGHPELGDTEQFSRAVRPALDRFAAVHLFALDAPASSTADGAVHYHVAMNTKGRMSYLMAALDPAAETVRVSAHGERIPRLPAAPARNEPLAGAAPPAGVGRALWALLGAALVAAAWLGGRFLRR